MSLSDAQVWGIILALGLGTYLIRFSFLGMFGKVELPGWLLRHLRYTPVAVLPGLVAPLIVWPGAGVTEPELQRVAVALVALAAGYLTRNVVWGVIAAGVTFWLVGYVV